ncbi:hypothetical protein LJC63_05785 [Ruminococcaceae bacterium OttesenSCG-928-L11]|nr:hypothetical protein [Ruminococcaceae bacterium OttesenSCG-928-L11]
MNSKSYTVCRIRDGLGLDALPVAKITEYPLEERDYRPFAQCQICVNNETELLARLWAFEVSPPPDSELRAVLHLFRDKPERALHIIARAEDGLPTVRAVVVENDAPIAEVRGECRDHSGEDLQGIYWGGEVTLHKDALEQAGGPVLFAPGEGFPGNFYKTCDSRTPHYGSWSPAGWEPPYAADGMGRIQYVSY